MLRAVPKPMSPEEYLEWEAKQEVRHEYVEGYVYAMAGASNRHNRVCLNIAAFCLAHAGDGCRVYQENVKLRLENLFYYPDVMVVCGGEPPHTYYETDPCILVEVLSPSTALNDVREKVLEYRRIQSLRSYLIVDPESLFVRHFWRDEAGTWQQQDITGSGEIPLPCLGVSLSLAQIYRGIY